MSGSIISFDANGGRAEGYLAIPESGNGIGVIVLQEWWGLVPHIKDITDRFAKAGYVALAPDLYDGQSTKSPDEAGKLMMALNISETEKKLRGAVDYLVNHESVRSKKVGTVGFCMGGMLSLFAATKNEKVGACVVFYGIHPSVNLELEGLNAPVLGLYAENDAFVPPTAVHELDAKFKESGKSFEYKIYEDVEHAFFNDTRPEVYQKEYADDAWQRVLKFYQTNL
jgi:carboxymethylenebutenolidase